MPRRRKKQSLAEPCAIELKPALCERLTWAWTNLPATDLRNYIRGLYLLGAPDDTPEIVEEARFLYDMCLHR